MEGLPRDRSPRGGQGHPRQGRRARRGHGGRAGRRAALNGTTGGRGRRIVLWRHGQTAWNLERRFQGSTDIELTEEGRGQARRAARLLAALRPDVIIASDLQRAATTASELAALTRLEVTHDAALRETYAGSWQGLTHDEILARHGEQYTAWKRGEPVRRGGGELETEVADRAAPVVLAHADKLPDDGTLVVVSHGGTIRTTIGRLLGLEAHHWEGLGGLSNCCWSVLGEGARGWRLLEHNAGTLPEPVLGDDD
ncbi:phosphoglycerate mutase [Streptomyces angustmyceticus]|uniref:Phosphoglycerate mutase n=1 Tax=Streptomyces angustmyceticus TaxID=285578 RepID=A0A5J4LDC0_9ACTN|nr:phosphoglycerate mutase [Streptomyces angustmyceticus]